MSRPHLLTMSVLLLPQLAGTNRAHTAENRAGVATVVPEEAANEGLHNPDMGWVLYENYPLDQDPNGSSTLLTLPEENFREVDAVALMFSWQDIEHQLGVYDFSKVDFAYDYWANRGKEIQLRLSATTLLWWAGREPPAGMGAPDYVHDALPAEQKQTRTLEGHAYVVEDPRNPYYRARLVSFLRAVDAHFSEKRPVALIDLRGFGVWGEWHSGFQFATLEERREALKGVIDLWASALPKRRLAISYSYDPDGPKELYAGPTKNFDAQFASSYDAYLAYSAFDHALTKANITFRRDGCGGAVHSNERKLCEEAFRLGRGPMFSEFVDGYNTSKKGGDAWVKCKVEDALSLHPNYVNLLGYQGADALAFTRERSELVEDGLRRMGYRLVPTRVCYPTMVANGSPIAVEMEWVNRGVGRALRDYAMELLLLGEGDRVVARSKSEALATSKWIAGESYPVEFDAAFDGAPTGKYQLAIRLHDPQTRRAIELPLSEKSTQGSYLIGPIQVATP